MLPAPFKTSCHLVVRRAVVLMYTELLVTSPECHMLIQPSGYKGVGCSSVASCYSLERNTDEMWHFVPQLLFEDLAAGVGLIWHPPSILQVPTGLFIPCLSAEAIWYMPLLPKCFLCTPHPIWGEPVLIHGSVLPPFCVAPGKGRTLQLCSA